MKAKKKPVIIDYFPITENEIKNTHELKKWVESFGDDFENIFIPSSMIYGTSHFNLQVKTLEGTSYDISDKDVIIRVVKGEYYPCKKDIFYETYDNID